MRSRPINAVRKRLCSNDSETVTPLVLSYSKAPLKRKGTYAAGTFSASAGRTSATTWWCSTRKRLADHVRGADTCRLQRCQATYPACGGCSEGIPDDPAVAQDLQRHGRPPCPLPLASTA